MLHPLHRPFGFRIVGCAGRPHPPVLPPFHWVCQGEGPYVDLNRLWVYLAYGINGEASGSRVRNAFHWPYDFASQEEKLFLGCRDDSALSHGPKGIPRYLTLDSPDLGCFCEHEKVTRASARSVLLFRDYEILPVFHGVGAVRVGIHEVREDFNAHFLLHVLLYVGFHPNGDAVTEPDDIAAYMLPRLCGFQFKFPEVLEARPDVFRFFGESA